MLRSRRERICSTTADLQPISRNGRGCSYNMPTENFSLFSRLVTVACSPVLPPNGSTARSSKEYVKWQPTSCGGITIAIYLNHLRLTLRYICPTEDWSWLLTISKRIATQAKRKPEKHHLVTSETLYALGMELMDRAIANGKRSQEHAIADAMHYRDGLIIALLALVPLRRRTLAALRIGKHLVRSGDLWLLDIPAEDIKTKRPIEYPISAELSGRIDLYLNQFRPQIPGAGTHDYLWASSRGRPMRDGSIYNSVRRRTRKALGFPVNLHRFRRAAATLWSTQDPANVRGVQRPARSCIIRYDGKILHYGAVAPCGTCSRSGDRALDEPQPS